MGPDTALNPHPAGSLTAPLIPKPLLRRPTLVRKRDDADEEAPPSSPGKRAKVSFDSDVEVRIVSDLAHEPQIIHEEVRLAFQKRAWGDRSGYEKIKAIYCPTQTDNHDVSERALKHYTSALLSNASSLSKECSDLVHAVLNSQWLGRDQDYISLFVRLLASLLTTHGVYLGDALRMLVTHLTSASPSNGRIPELPPVSRSTIFLRLHDTLRYILQLIPSASRSLLSVLVSMFPHQTGSSRAHAIYVQNLLTLTKYAPELRSDLLALITERLVKIDVQIQVDLEDMAEEVGEGLVQKIPQLRSDLLHDEDSSDSSDNDDSEDNDEDDDDEARRTRDIFRNVDKMDTIMDILFGYYDRALSSNSINAQVEIIDILLSQFVTIILPTHRSRHTQFLLFHITQMSPEYIDTFVGTCVQITFDRKQPAIVRQAAAAYLASFVARGTHVPANIIVDVFDYIGSELGRLRREYEPNCKGPDLKRYLSYYCLVQALLYIFCFRWRDLESTPDEDSEDDDLASYDHERQWKAGVRETMSLNIFSRLNPLKVCSPAIVTEFARVANHLGVVFVFHLLETNKRVRVSQFLQASTRNANHYQPDRETALSMSKDESHHQLDEYFPFDPYHLPKSKRWIGGDYREWVGVPGLDDEQGSDTDSDMDDDDRASEIADGTETDETKDSL